MRNIGFPTGTEAINSAHAVGGEFGCRLLIKNQYE